MARGPLTPVRRCRSTDRAVIFQPRTWPGRTFGQARLSHSIYPIPNPHAPATAAPAPTAIAPVTAAEPPQGPPSSATPAPASPPVPAMPIAMADRFGFRIVLLEDICCRLVQFFKNSTAAWNAGQGAARANHACECSRTRQANNSCKEQSSIHENLPICRPGESSAITGNDLAFISR